jgi:hypothetical protein
MADAIKPARLRPIARLMAQGYRPVDMMRRVTSGIWCCELEAPNPWMGKALDLVAQPRRGNQTARRSNPKTPAKAALINGMLMAVGVEVQ